MRKHFTYEWKQCSKTPERRGLQTHSLLGIRPQSERLLIWEESLHLAETVYTIKLFSAGLISTHSVLCFCHKTPCSALHTTSRWSSVKGTCFLLHGDMSLCYTACSRGDCWSSVAHITGEKEVWGGVGGGGSVFLLAAYNSKKKKVGKTTQIQGANYPEDKIIHHITAMVNDWMVNSSV